jgi:hypothetical protein
MPIRKLNAVMERAGVNYVRGVVESNNSVFKEQDLRYDYGHDAFVLLVEGEHVLPKEIAMQIKSGASYCTPTACKIPATGSQLVFWAGHDLDTLGVVHDPNEGVAYWVDLKVEAKIRVRGQREQSGAVIEFPKMPWNRIDARMFREFLVPTLQGKAPLIDLATSLEWARSDHLDTHDLGVRILSSRHWRDQATWDCMFELFLGREAARTTPRVGIEFAKAMGHPDDASPRSEWPEHLRESIRERVVAFGKDEIVKLLHHVEDLERGGIGYGLMSALAARPDCSTIFATIRDDPTIDEHIREKARGILRYDEYEPLHLWHWTKDGR